MNYVAQWRSRVVATGNVVKVKARSLDVYRKTKGAWIQVASNLNYLPTEGAFTTPGADRFYQIAIEVKK